LDNIKLTIIRLLWALSAPFLGVYVIVQNLNIPLILQPQLFCTFALISWGQVRNVLTPTNSFLNKYGLYSVNITAASVHDWRVL